MNRVQAVPRPHGPPEAATGTLIVVAMETIWPANHGGRVDRWTRWRQLKALGWRLVFVSWSPDDSHEDPAHLAAMSDVFDACFFFPNRLSLASLARRIVMLPRQSPHMAARHVNASDRGRLLTALRTFDADAVVMDGVFGSDLGIALADDLGVPLIYRSHNIEHLYMRRQAAAAQTAKRRLAMWLASLHVDRAELKAMRRARWTFDISTDDMQFWARHGIERASWLPPLLDTAAASLVPPTAWDERKYDVVYVGNLSTPNNVEGLVWLARHVMPLLPATGLRVLLAGSRPHPSVLALAAQDDRITVLADPDDVTLIRRDGRVLINPVLQGSGVNVKSVEMLTTDSPLVTTSIGVQGLDASTRAAFLIADDPAHFAQAILSALGAGPVPLPGRHAAQDRFGVQAVRDLSDRLMELIHNGHESGGQSGG